LHELASGFLEKADCAAAQRGTKGYYQFGARDAADWRGAHQSPRESSAVQHPKSMAWRIAKAG